MKTKLWLFLLIILLLPHVRAYAQWVEQNSGITISLEDVDFVDSLYGWAVGKASTILHTTDGGNTWVKQECPVDTIVFNRVQFINRDIGYIVGYYGAFLSTIDGGSNWNLDFIVENEFQLTDLSFINADMGWVVGGNFYWPRDTGIILKTTDKGKTWVKQLEIISPNYFSSKLFHAVESYNELDVFAIAGDYVDNFSSTFLYKTSDGGNSWESVGQVDSPMWRLYVPSKDTIWACGIGMAISKNGGEDWMPHGWGGNVNDLVALSGKEGWVIAQRLDDKNIHYTSDCGLNWELKKSIEGNGFSSIDNFEKDTFWMVGDSGRIAKYIPNITSIKQEIELYNFGLEQNYPNPFNYQTQINFCIPSYGNISLAVYDIKGALVKQLISQIIPAGRYSITWNGRNSGGKQVSSGAYIYELKYQNQLSTKKLLLIK